MFYVDTSILVAALTPEVATARIQAWLAARGADDLAVSTWTITEFSAALSLKVRVGALQPDHRASVLIAFERIRTLSLQTLAVADRVFVAAARLADRHAEGLRAGDALHVAMAIDRGVTLATLDRRLATAAQSSGVVVDSP